MQHAFSILYSYGSFRMPMVCADVTVGSGPRDMGSATQPGTVAEFHSETSEDTRPIGPKFPTFNRRT